MAATEILVVSDTHLSRQTGEAVDNWDAVVALAEQRRPALVLHLGDLTVDAPRHPEQLDFARRALDRLPVDWRAIPGNHDVGDNPPPYMPGDEPTEEGRQRWLDAVGPDWWHVEVAGVQVVGVDAQLFGTGIESEAEQWRWLESTLDAVAARGLVVLASHKPVAPALAAEESKEGRYVPAACRERLQGLLDRADARLVLSGHVHQYLDFKAGGRRHVWAPTSWAVVPDEVQSTVGAKRCGVLTVDVAGGRPGAVEMLEPAGVAQHTIGHDIPNPYAGT